MKMKTLLPSVCHRPTRRGVSLVELMIATAIGGLVMMLGLGMLSLMLKTERTLADSLQRRQTSAQFARNFRRDVHAAAKAELIGGQNENDSPGLSLELKDNHQVRYSADGNAVVRVETEGEKTIQSARFRFAEGTKTGFQIEDAMVSARVQIPNTTTPKRRIDSEAPLRELMIQGTKGRDHRFMKSP